MSVTVTLPDGSTLSFDQPVTVEDVAYEIGTGLGDDTVAGVINGDLVAKEDVIDEDCSLEIVTEGSDEYIDVLRHTAAHVFAQAVKRLFPEAKLTIGPWTDDGFYYDLAGVELDKEALEEIEEEAASIIEEDLAVERNELSRDEAEEFFEDNRYKQEILDEEAGEGDSVTFYTQGEFEDLCKGPHVSSTGVIGGFKLLEISAAYWRGDEENETLTRVYGTAFEQEGELEEFLEQRRKAQQRDHRKIGQEMDLFSIDETTGPGLPLYHPNGRKVLDILRRFVDGMNRERGYDYVETPHLFKTDLWKKSGHYDNYADDMFLFEMDEEEYGLKPMNCPGHATIFDQRKWSYRDLPVKYAENGKVYRKEQRGELSGLSRVWAFTIDDGHLFVRPDQIDEQVEEIMEMIFDVLETFGLEYDVFLATRPDKSVGSDEIWERSEKQLREVLERNDIEYGLEEGDGAFYGPKIDFAFHDALGREWDGPTIQLDFNLPERFDLHYRSEDNEEVRPVMIHRALYGSYERFFMVLIEHFGGDFPAWLAPEQVRILPISDDQMDYARQIKEQLAGFRATIEDRSWTLGRKIQEAHDDRVPYMIIVGENEAEDRTIAVRDRDERETQDVDPAEFREHLAGEIEEKRLQPDFLDE